jgi:NTP pyrophosphatase (non-canonical NTP hydrolase)
MLLANEMMDTIHRVRDLTVKDLTKKDIFRLFLKAVEELGEFAEALQIEEKVYGNTYKERKEGTLGEAADMIIMGLCLFYARGGNHAMLIELLNKKLDKWEQKNSLTIDPPA